VLLSLFSLVLPFPLDDRERREDFADALLLFTEIKIVRETTNRLSYSPRTSSSASASPVPHRSMPLVISSVTQLPHVHVNHNERSFFKDASSRSISCAAVADLAPKEHSNHLRRGRRYRSEKKALR
jgi:hypothetical protein